MNSLRLTCKRILPTKTIRYGGWLRGRAALWSLKESEVEEISDWDLNIFWNGMLLQNLKYLNSIFLLALIYKSWPGHYIDLVEKLRTDWHGDCWVCANLCSISRCVSISFVCKVSDLWLFLQVYRQKLSFQEYLIHVNQCSFNSPMHV